MKPLTKEMEGKEELVARIGEKMGTSLVTCDVDGDLKEEVLFGAPFGRVTEHTTSDWSETGKVVVTRSKVLS